MQKKASLVFTTINDPVLLEDYFRNFKKFDHLERVNAFVIPDRKTPKEAYQRCEGLAKQGWNITCPTIEAQEKFLSHLGLSSEFIPYDSDNRRNIGYLMALESGTDFTMSIDDDNFCQPDEDFFRAHAVVCQGESQEDVVTTDNAWFNICELMETDTHTRTYARGFPYYARHKKEKISSVQKKVDVHMNAGLWLLDPDVDGISWLVNPVHTTAFKGMSVVLGDKAWSPINTQNTSLRRDVIAAYYFVKMRYPLGGFPIDRYGDIFSGYFSQACVRHMGGSIRVGTPIAEHRRNSHNYMNDAANEMACVLVLEDMLPWLTNDVRLSGKTYAEAYVSLSHALEEAVEKFSGRIWTDATKAYFHQMAFHMRRWAAVCETLQSGRKSSSIPAAATPRT